MLFEIGDKVTKIDGLIFRDALIKIAEDWDNSYFYKELGKSSDEVLFHEVYSSGNDILAYSFVKR